MIRRQLDIVTTAAQTLVVIMRDKGLKLGGGIPSSSHRLAGTATVDTGCVFTRIRLVTAASSLVYLIVIRARPLAKILMMLIGVILSPTCGYLMSLVGIGLSPIARFFPYFIRVFFLPAAIVVFGAQNAIAVLIPLASSASCTRLAVLGRHRKTPVAMPQELNYNRPATRRLPGLSSRLGVFTALPGHLLTLNYTTRGDLEPLGQVYFR
jgi:hypothetical protein